MAISALVPLFHLAMNHPALLLQLAPMSPTSELAIESPSRSAFLAENAAFAEKAATTCAKKCDSGVVPKAYRISRGRYKRG
jgi:hypothetical protein